MTRAKEAVFTGRMLNAQVAKDWGMRFKLASLARHLHLISLIGLVDYVAEAPSTAYNRALELAAEMAGSGAHIVSDNA